MDNDTIFPALSNGEQIIGKYGSHALRKGTKFIAILTDHRLLARSRQTVCCCYHCSSYTSISLESINRVDEHRARPNASLYSALWILWLFVAIGGVLASFFATNNPTIKTIGIIVSFIPLILTTIIIFSCLCCCFKRKFIELKGTFGSITMIFDKEQARIFEAELNEQISQAKRRFQPSTISRPNFYRVNEKQTSDQQIIVSNHF